MNLRMLRIHRLAPGVEAFEIVQAQMAVEDVVIGRTAGFPRAGRCVRIPEGFSSTRDVPAGPLAIHRDGRAWRFPGFLVHDSPEQLAAFLCECYIPEQRTPIDDFLRTETGPDRFRRVVADIAHPSSGEPFPALPMNLAPHPGSRVLYWQRDDGDLLAWKAELITSPPPKPSGLCHAMYLAYRAHEHIRLSIPARLRVADAIIPLQLFFLAGGNGGWGWNGRKVGRVKGWNAPRAQIERATGARFAEALDRSGWAEAASGDEPSTARPLVARWVLEISLAPPEAFGAQLPVITSAYVVPPTAAVRVPRDTPILRDPSVVRAILARTRGGVFVPDDAPQDAAAVREAWRRMRAVGPYWFLAN